MKYADLHDFVKERVIEILKKNTIESHRERIHNAYTILLELKDLLKKRKDKRIQRFETVQLCIDEVIDELKKDDCLNFSYYNKEHFINELNKYYKEEKDSNYYSVSFLVDRILIDNPSCNYLKELIAHLDQIWNNTEELKAENFTPVVRKLDYYISSLCSQLIHSGYSKSFLLSSLQKQLEEEKKDDKKQFYSKLKSLALLHKQSRFHVKFKIDITGNGSKNVDLPQLKEEIDDVYLNESMKTHKKFIRGTQATNRIIKVESFDSYMAILKAKEELNVILDSIQMVLNSVKLDIHDTAFALLSKDDGSFIPFIGSTKNYLDVSIHSKAVRITKIQETLNNILKSDKIADDVKVRIKSAIRHLRIANNETEIEQRLLNYWIALEFIFSSPNSSDNTFPRIKEHLLNIMMCCYAKRNIYWLNKQLLIKGLIAKEDKIWNINDAQLNTLTDSVDNILLKYRLKEYKAIFFNKKEKLKQYLKHHEDNVIRNLSRIYSLRNELVHEAAIKQNIEGVTSNLRYYLVFVLNQLLGYMNRMTAYEKNTDMNDFFNEYSYTIKEINSCFESKSTTALNEILDKLMKIPFNHGLIY